MPGRSEAEMLNDDWACLGMTHDDEGAMVDAAEGLPDAVSPADPLSAVDTQRVLAEAFRWLDLLAYAPTARMLKQGKTFENYGNGL